MISKSNLRLLFLDTEGGGYLPQALLLSQYFSKTYYHIPQVNPFPTPYSDAIGTGYEQITHLQDIWNNLDLFDIVLIPDLYLADYGDVLRKLGKLTFGGDLDYIEQKRDKFYECLQRYNMAVAPYEVIKGFKNFRKLISQKKYAGYYGKLNYYRGIGETMAYDGYNTSEPLLNKLESELGPLGDDLTYILQAPINSKNMIEIGMDSWVIKGQIPQMIQFGVEAKDSAYLGRWIDKSKAPKAIEEINQAFQPYMDALKPTNFYSTEIRCDLDNKVNYYNDICARMAAPASLAEISNCSNWNDIIEQGARGILVEPIPVARYVVELLIKSAWASDDFLAIEVPEEYKPNLHLKGSFIRNGITYISPFKKSANYNLLEVGSVVVCGNDVNEIMNKAVEIADSIKGLDITYDKDVLENIQAEIDNMSKKIGFKF